MGNIIGAAVQVILNALGGAANAGNPQEALIVAVMNLSAQVRALASALGRYLHDVMGAWQFAKAHVIGAGQAIGDLGYDQRVMWHHLLTVILPDSLQYTVGYVFSKGIVPLRAQVAGLQNQIRFLLGWRGQIDTWRRDWADPNITAWRAWHAWFLGWPQTILLRWQRWFDRPAEFAAWAAAPLIGPTLGYYSDPAHQRSTDTLATIVVDATPDVWRHVEQAIVQILQTKVD